MHRKEFSHALPAGTPLDVYEVIEAIGSGGFGITYKALDTQLKHLVAIKEYLPVQLAWREENSTVIPRTTDDIENFQYGLDQFIEEGRTLARFKHTNIVRVIRYFKANGTAYLVMEYEHGQTFKEYLQQHPRPDEATLSHLMTCILQGLKSIHDQGFLHRDIKPSNIYLREDGNPLLIDFGSARQALTRHTQSLTGIVTEGFAPFEQYSGNIKQTAATDLYSLGATLHFSITGNVALNAVDRFNTLRSNHPDPLSTLTKANKALYSRYFLQLVDWLLEIYPENRPQTTTQVLQSLTNQRLPDLTKTVANLNFPVKQKPKRSRFKLLATFSVIATFTIIGIILLSLAPQKITHQKDTQSTPKTLITPLANVTPLGSTSSRSKNVKKVIKHDKTQKSVETADNHNPNRMNTKIFESINEHVNARLIVVPYANNTFLFSYKNFKHRFDNKALLYTRVFRTKPRYYYQLTGFGSKDFTSNGMTIHYKGRRQEYYELNIFRNRTIKMIFVKNAELSVAAKVIKQYQNSQGPLMNRILAQKHIQRAVTQFNKRCRSNLSAEVDWNAFKTSKQTTTPSMGYAYIKALERVCLIDDDYGNAARNIKILAFKPSKTPGKDKVVNTAGTKITIYLDRKVANIAVTSFEKIKQSL